MFMSMIDRDVPQMGVDGFVVEICCSCHFKTIWQRSANQSDEGGREGSGWVATVALVRTKRHSHGSPGDKNPATRINNNNN